jgi:hypothetical protein
MDGSGLRELQPSLFGLVADVLSSGRRRLPGGPAVAWGGTLRSPIPIPSGAWTVIRWQVHDGETSALWPPSAPGRFTCPADGLYRVTLKGAFAPAGGDVRTLAVRRNGTRLLCAGTSCVVLAPLQAGDTIEGLAYQNSGRALHFGGEACLRIERMG